MGEARRRKLAGVMSYRNPKQSKRKISRRSPTYFLMLFIRFVMRAFLRQKR
jgi:hypothetical protein